MDVGSVTGAPQNAQENASNGIGSLGSDAFLTLLVAQLRYQNPMSPTDGTAMLQQTAQFTQVEALKAISEANQQILGLQQTSMALNLVGRDVSALDLDGNPVSGTVTEVRFTADGPILDVDGIKIPLPNVISVQPAEQTP
ncbi:flagellar basal body rod modification protein [bacterium BMS3Bbin02]|nr:flagellar basal body rod modification protein [bacterium BMS3Bbin02]